jgi:hypothetical protein
VPKKDGGRAKADLSGFYKSKRESGRLEEALRDYRLPRPEMGQSLASDSLLELMPSEDGRKRLP